MTQTQQAIVPVNPAAVPIALSVFGHERLALLKEQIGRGWPEPMTDAELEHIGAICQRTRLDPLSVPRQIHFTKFKDRKLNKYVITAITGIDGFRLIAQRSRQYGGATPYLYCGPDGVWKEFWTEDEPPVAAKVGVKRKGWTEWLWAVATWKEWARYEPTGWDDNTRRYTGKKLSDFWARMPSHMLGKTAEAIALKRAFPEETNELELAAIEAEARVEQTEQANRYTEIFGSEDAAFYDLPSTRALNASGQTVDTDSGEVIAEDCAAEPAAAATEGRAPESAPSGARRPSQSALWAANKRLVEKARELGVQGVPTLANTSTGDAIETANAELGRRIAEAEGRLV